MNENNQIICVKCGEFKTHECKGMCHNCYEYVRIQNAKLDETKHEIDVECNESKFIVVCGMCKNCYHKIFTSSKIKAKKLSIKMYPKINHKPKPIAKIELASDSEDNFEKSKNVNSNKEVDSKVGIKMELKCEPSTSKE